MYGDFPAKNTVYTPYMPINVWFGQPCSFALRSPKLVEIIAAVPEEHKASLMPQLKVCAPGKPARFSFLCVQCNTFKASRPPSSCSFCVHIFTRLARTIYLRCINSIFGREITKYTVIRCIYTVLANPTYSLGPLLPQYTQSVRTANAADIAPTRDGAICTLFATPASQLPLAIATSLQLY